MNDFMWMMFRLGPFDIIALYLLLLLVIRVFIFLLTKKKSATGELVCAVVLLIVFFSGFSRSFLYTSEETEAFIRRQVRGQEAPAPVIWKGDPLAVDHKTVTTDVVDEFAGYWEILVRNDKDIYFLRVTKKDGKWIVNSRKGGRSKQTGVNL